MKRRGLSLLETVLGLGILIILLGAFFAMLTLATHTYRRAITRHNVQSDTQRIAFLLAEDLRRSHYLTVSKLPTRSWSGRFERNAICMAGVRDWSAADAIDPVTSRPKWNRYLLYYCVSQPDDEPVTRLYRCWVLPDHSDEMGQFAFPGLRANIHCRPDPSTCSEIESFNLLSSIVESFSVESAPNSQWQATFVLHQQGVRGQEDQVVETTLSIRPENTFPVYY